MEKKVQTIMEQFKSVPALFKAMEEGVWGDIFSKFPQFGLNAEIQVNEEEDGTKEWLIPVPGFSKEEVGVAFSEGTLVVTANKGDGNDSSDQRVSLYIGDLNPDSMSAGLENGILHFKAKPFDTTMTTIRID